MATETDAQRWLRRARAAATEATVAGVGPEELAAEFREGVLEGQRVLALRSGTYTPPAPAPREPVDVPAGSAIDALLRATNAA
jgi:hypothetical protein